MRNSLLAASLALTTGLLSEANATSMTRLSHEQLVDAADMIVRGTVTEVWTESNENGNIWTRAQIEVQYVLKGDVATDVLVLDQPGGEWSNIASRVSGTARFSVGEEAYFFVEHLRNGRDTPLGWYQGKFTVQFDPYSRQEVVQRFLAPPGRAYDHRFIPLPAEDKRVFVDDFEARIHQRMIVGWDGEPILGFQAAHLKRISPALTAEQAQDLQTRARENVSLRGVVYGPIGEGVQR